MTSMTSFLSSRRAFLSTLSAAMPALAAKKERGPIFVPPNIVLIIADELPASMLGCYGNRDLRTPNIDALARRGIRFQNALASGRGGATGRATLLAGRTSMQTSMQTGASGALITDLFAAKGYDVAFVGVWGLGNDKQPGHGIRWSFTTTGDQKYWNGEPAEETGDAPAVLARRGAQFLEQQKLGGKPFLLTVSNPASTGVAALDNQLPILIGKLRERNLEENTMIVFTSAGGTPEALPSPLIYCWPGHSPVEATRPDMIGAYDLSFTLCAAAGLAPLEGNLCGRSYLPLVKGRTFHKKNPWRTIVYGNFDNAETASDNRFKLVIRDGGRGPNQFFDLRANPNIAATNLYNNRAFVTARDMLRRNLTQWKNQYSR